MTLPTTEQLEAKFDELHHVQENIENERLWYWYGIATYCQLVAEQRMKDYEQFKAEIEKGFVAMQTESQLKERRSDYDSNND